MADYPAMPLWTDAYLGDTRHLSTLEHGAYLLLLMEAWRRPRCSLPDDDALLAKLAGLSDEEWARVKPAVMGFWKLNGRTREFTQKRLTKEKKFVAKNSRAQSDRAVKRWKGTKKNDAAAMPDECRIDAPTPTPTPTIEAAAANARARDPDPNPQTANRQATGLISTFDAVRTEIFGAAQSRPWPHAQDISYARRWLEAGADPDLVSAVCRAKMAGLRAKGRSPPRGLAYFDQPIADALEARNQPMPQGKPDAAHQPNHQPTKTDRAKAAVMRAAVAGGYAAPGSGGPEGSGDDNLSVFPVAQALRQGTGGA